MKLKLMKLSDLRPSGYNPRVELKVGDPEFERLKNSIETFGNVEPIVWNKRTGHIVGGHQRLEVLKAMGVMETHVSVVDLNDDDEKLLNVALNKIKGEWDYDKLPELLKSFGPEEAMLSGFSPQEITILCADANAASEYAVEDALSANTHSETNETDEFINDDSTPETQDADSSGDGQRKPAVFDFDGASWVVALIFKNPAVALDWMTERGLGEHVREGTRTTVIRMEQ